MSNPDLSSSPSKLPPDEERLAALLERLRPRPTARFYHRMASAPWKSAAPEARRFRAWPSRRAAMRALAAGAVLLALAVLSVFVFPPLNATARRLMSFFAPSPSLSLELEVTAPSPGDPNIFGAPGYFSLTLVEAERLAGFPVRQIPLAEGSNSIPGLVFDGAHYDSLLQAVTLRYSTQAGSLFLTQRKLGSIKEYNTIGPGAPVEQVSVHGIQGEYVTGGWIPVHPLAATSQPGTQVSMDVVWDPTLPQHILRWQEGDFLYEILTSASLGSKIELEKETLVEIAESIH